MLSKSGARMFFLVGTGACSLAFVLLTADTLARVPAQTRQEHITPAVERGKHLWESNNCMGCHTLLGEGAYYAPELTRVYERRGPEFIRAMLRDPESMYPGRRRMQQYDFTEAEIDDLVAFLEWVNGMDLNGFPPPPVLASGPTTQSAIGGRNPHEGSPEVFRQTCVACHSVGGAGGDVGPALDTVADRFDAAYLDRWLRDPEAVRPGTAMPQLPLTDVQVHELTTYLATLRSAPSVANEAQQ